MLPNWFASAPCHFTAPPSQASLLFLFSVFSTNLLLLSNICIVVVSLISTVVWKGLQTKYSTWHRVGSNDYLLKNLTNILKLCDPCYKCLIATQRIILGKIEFTGVKLYSKRMSPPWWNLNPHQAGLGEKHWGVRALPHGLPVTWSGHQPGWWSKLLLFHICRGAVDWIAVLETRLYVYRAGKKLPAQPAHPFDGTVKALNQDSAVFLYPVLHSTQCHPQVAKSLDFLWVGTETSRDWKERLKLHRGVHQQNQICAHLPVLASIIGPDQQPWIQWRTQKNSEKAWPEIGPEAEWQSRSSSLCSLKVHDQELWPQKNLSLDPGSSCFYLRQDFCRHHFISSSQWLRWGSTQHVKVRARTRTHAADSSTRALSPASYHFHVLLLWTQEKVLSLLLGWRPWEKPLSERPLSQKRSMTIVRGGVTACWFSF